MLLPHITFLSIDKVLDPDSAFFGCSAPQQGRSDIIQVYLRKKRSEEQIGLLSGEMEQTIQYLEQKLREITQKCDDIINDDADCMEMFGRGAHNVLTHYKW